MTNTCEIQPRPQVAVALAERDDDNRVSTGNCYGMRDYYYLAHNLDNTLDVWDGS